jgi:hypothetical protein
LFQVGDLSTGHKYLFRLKAVGSGGAASEASDPSKEVVLKGKQRPIIDRKLLEASVRAKKGQTVVLNAK